MSRPDDNSNKLEAVATARFASDPERIRLARLLEEQYAQLKQTQNAIYIRDTALICEEKERLGIPNELTNFECQHAEAHYGIG